MTIQTIWLGWDIPDNPVASGQNAASYLFTHATYPIIDTAVSNLLSAQGMTAQTVQSALKFENPFEDHDQRISTLEEENRQLRSQVPPSRQKKPDQTAPLT